MQTLDRTKGCRTWYFLLARIYLNLTGALMWWGPNFAFYGAKASYGNRPGAKAITQADISYKFGIVMTLAGLLGVPGGSYVAQTLRHRYFRQTFKRRLISLN